MGRYNTPGLPNIVGMMSNTMSARSGMNSNGAIGGSYDLGTGQIDGTQSLAFVGFKFNSSWSNGIYGSSTTVMPASTDMLCGLYLGRTA